MTARLALLPGLWLLSTILAVQPAQAIETVRVALSKQATRVRIHADQARLRIEWPSGQTTTSRRPVHVEWSPEGLVLNGRLHRIPSIRLAARASDLTITVQESRARDPGRSWVVDGDVVLHRGGSTLVVVNHVPLEPYVAGVVAGEIDPAWHPEALKAQAVAARTYVLYKVMHHPARAYDVVASVEDQVYHGRRHINGAIRRAVAATKGIVITYERRPIYAAYSSTAAGPTEDAFYVWALDLPYLKGVDCPFDEAAPRYTWEVAVPVATVEQRLRATGHRVGIIATLTPFSFTPSGRVDRIRILHSQGELIVSGQELRRIVGYARIFSTRFTVERLDRALVLQGKGAGHGVGLCQWGMKEMAELGYEYRAILRYYYPGTRLLPLHRVNLTPPD